MEKWELTPEELERIQISRGWQVGNPQDYFDCIVKAIAAAAGEKARRESESERDALRAEVEVLRRAVSFLAGKVDCACCAYTSEEGFSFRCHRTEADCIKDVTEWAISEARREKR